MKTKICFEIPIVTVSEANSSDHWTKKRKRHQQQQQRTRQAYARHVKYNVTFPCCVTLIRLGPRLLDDDNNVSAFKWVRDELSECLLPHERKCYVTKTGKVKSLKGRADSDERIAWKYVQKKYPIRCIIVEIDF